MRTVAKIIELGGGLERLADHSIRLEGPPGLMGLVIEYVGVGPRGLPLVSVAHYFEQAGDLLADPELTFEVDGADWHPLTFQQDGLGVFQEAVYQGEDGQVIVRPRPRRDLQDFARTWDENLASQGYIQVARGGCSGSAGDLS